MQVGRDVSAKWGFGNIHVTPTTLGKSYNGGQLGDSHIVAGLVLEMYNGGSEY